MKNLMAIVMLAAATAFTFTPAAQARGHSSSGHTRASTPSYGTGSSMRSSHVKGYVTKKGAYVAPHSRSKGDSSINNNWSTKGNTNPYTGKSGTKRGNP